MILIKMNDSVKTFDEPKLMSSHITENMENMFQKKMVKFGETFNILKMLI